MSHPWGISGRIAVLTPVTTVTEAVAAGAAGASLVDVGDDDELIPAIRDASREVRISGRGSGADIAGIVSDVALAARSGAGLICPDPDAAARAVRSGITAERIVLAAAPAGIPAAVRSGWAVLVDVDEGADSAAEAQAVAAVCGWLGASVIRTRYVAGVRRCLDMTESILASRPPAWTLRGLA
jgi:hypothetical protein